MKNFWAQKAGQASDVAEEQQGGFFSKNFAIAFSADNA